MMGLFLSWVGAFTALIFALFHFSDPLTGDGIPFWGYVQRVLGILRFNPAPMRYEIFHPPTYLFCLVTSVKLFGLSPAAFHGVGLLSFLLTLWLLRKVTLSVYTGQEGREVIAGLVCFLYAINPFVIQGSLVVDIDNTILPIFLLLFTLLLMRGPEEGREGRWKVGLSLLLALSFWAKPTTTLALPVVMVFWGWGQIGFRKALKRSVEIFLFALSLFFVTYILFSKVTGNSFIEMLKDYRDQFFVRTHVSFVSNVNLRDFGLLLVFLRNLLRLVFWVGPFLSLAILLGIWTETGRLLRRKKTLSADFFWGFALVILAVYTLFGGPAFGFPKYQLPFLTFSMIPLGGFLYPFFKQLLAKEARNRTLFLGGLCVLFQILFVGDLLYLSDYALREKLILDPGSVRPFLISLATRCLLSLFPLLILFRKKGFTAALLIAAVSQSLALDLIQAKAPYQTTFTYGASGTKEMILLLKSHFPPHGKTLAPPDISQQMDIPRVEYDWSNENPKTLRRDLTRILQEEDIGCFGYGISAVTLRQNRLFREESFQQLLSEDFVRHDIGSYTLWFRKKGPAP